MGSRCYEFYCLIRKDLSSISCIKSKKSECEIKAYIDVLRMKYDVKFNGFPDDKAKFEDVQKDFPEREVWRKQSYDDAIKSKYINPKFHDKTAYPTIQLKIDKNLKELVDGYFNFKEYNSAQEYLSELLEKALKQLIEARTNPQETLT